MRSHVRSSLARALASALVLAGCHPAPVAAPASAASSVAGAPAQPRASTGAGRQPATAGVPDTRAGRELAWLLGVLAGGGHADAATLQAHFDPAYLAGQPTDQLAAALVELARHLAALSDVVTTARDDAHVTLRGAAPEGRFALALGLDPASHRIAELDVGPDIVPGPSSLPEAVARLDALAPSAQLLIAALDGPGPTTAAASRHRGATCTPLFQHNPDAELAIASAFKLYVLLGLADHVADGRAAWTDAVAMRDAWRSLPGGITQDEPTGARLTLRTLAERMISISDNTASDILIETVGRRRVEAALGATGHANPALNVPFLETRELFWLKMAAPAAEVTRYLSLVEAPRRAYLERLAGKRPTASFDDWTTPRHIDRIEWFASSTDLCRAMAALWTRGQTPAGAPVLEVLAKNPGLIPGTLAPWSYAGFKGGSEPGVANATWLLQRKADQRWFVVTLGLNGPTAIDEGAIIGLASGVLAILANDAP